MDNNIPKKFLFLAISALDKNSAQAQVVEYIRRAANLLISTDPENVKYQGTFTF